VRVCACDILHSPTSPKIFIGSGPQPVIAHSAATSLTLFFTTFLLQVNRFAGAFKHLNLLQNPALPPLWVSASQISPAHAWGVVGWMTKVPDSIDSTEMHTHVE
jgi:hypothetical protein